ncbi:MAG: L,D-transpeptidase [Chloroflexota bacterium]
MEGHTTTSDRLTRREFLGASGLGLLFLALPAGREQAMAALPQGQLGRVAGLVADVYRQPSFAGEFVRRLLRDTVVPLDSAEVGEHSPQHNLIWYHIPDLGYVHSSPIQPVRDEPNEPIRSLPRGGRLMEITVPFVDAYWRPNSASDWAYRFYYSSVHWVDGVGEGVDGEAWYRIRDDQWSFYYYAHGSAFRPIEAEELSPLSTDVPASEKRIVVDLARQWTQCLEGSRVVLSTKISSGVRISSGGYLTPTGSFTTYRKRPTHHMAVGTPPEGYDLPGVPWVSYITESGVSFHGTYWHNDFGAPRSHGCINMTPAAAKWLFRWTEPAVRVYQEEVRVDAGTAVAITA